MKTMMKAREKKESKERDEMKAAVKQAASHASRAAEVASQAKEATTALKTEMDTIKRGGVSSLLIFLSNPSHFSSMTNFLSLGSMPASLHFFSAIFCLSRPSVGKANAGGGYTNPWRAALPLGAPRRASRHVQARSPNHYRFRELHLLLVPACGLSSCSRALCGAA